MQHKKTILITGINGFLGSHLAKRFSSSFKIIGLEYSLDNLFRLGDRSFKVYATANNNLEEVFEKNFIDIIIHTATYYGGKANNIPKIAETNFIVPFYLLDLAIKKNVPIFINTDTVLDRYVNPYALTKKQFLEWLYFRRNEIKVINLQLEQFYGKESSPNNFIKVMISKLKNNEPVINLTQGDQKRNFVHIYDIVSAFQTILNNYPLDVNYSEFQVTTGNPISIKELMLLLKDMIGSSSELNFGAIPYRNNELMISKSDNTDLLKLGWEPKYNLIDGLMETLENNRIS
ncbi:MAG: NAD(P)-dependent oxidoreductase [Bacteroidetes bacterium]|nr:NAD(P)-dependent oxidoreductase [Bacteroidota bacterium]MBT5530658.1 NAD(P)-dependent oxidoreductase [Cytophagia bacterium]